MTIDEFWNTDQRVNRALQAKTTTAQYNSHISAAAIPIRLSNSCSKLSSLVNKTLRYLNFSIWGSKSLPSQSAQSTFFLDLEVLTLILTTSHLVTNHPSKRWRSQPDKAIRTTSSTNSSDATLKDPKLDNPRLLLRLEILSMNTTDRIWDKGQPWWSPTLIGNKSDLTTKNAK